MFSIKLGNRVNQALFGLLAFLLLATPALAQSRPLYVPGFAATNSGMLPAPGLTYMNYFDYFSFDKLKGPGGDTINSELDSAVFIDMNVFLGLRGFVWVENGISG